MHIIPMEHPNRRFPSPPPFVWHPELFPQLAQNNPQPYDLQITAGKKKKKVQRDRTMRSAEPLAYTVLPKDNFEHRFKTPIEYRTNFLKHAIKTYEWKSNAY